MTTRMEQTLAQAHRAGQLVKITCQHCQITRYFTPTDLERVLGDVPFRYALAAMRCGTPRSFRWPTSGKGGRNVTQRFVPFRFKRFAINMQNTTHAVMAQRHDYTAFSIARIDDDSPARHAHPLG